MGQFFGSVITHTLQKIWGVAPGLFIFEVFTGLWLSTPTFCIKGYDYVKRFVRVLVLLMINTGCPKKLLKMGNTALLISSSNYAKTPYKCVHRRWFVFPVFKQFFWNTLYEGWFWCKDFPRLMNEGRFPQVGDSIFFCLPRLYLCMGEQPFSHTKSKASEYEQLILASTPGKSLRRFRKDNNHLEKFDTC